MYFQKEVFTSSDFLLMMNSIRCSLYTNYFTSYEQDLNTCVSTLRIKQNFLAFCSLTSVETQDMHHFYK